MTTGTPKSTGHDATIRSDKINFERDSGTLGGGLSSPTILNPSQAILCCISWICWRSAPFASATVFSDIAHGASRHTRLDRNFCPGFCTTLKRRHLCLCIHPLCQKSHSTRPAACYMLCARHFQPYLTFRFRSIRVPASHRHRSTVQSMGPV